MTDSPFRFEIDRVKTHTSRAEIVASLREYGRLHQRETFGMRDYDGWKKRLVTSDTIRRQFGSWAKALHEAGFRAVRGQKVDPAAMVAAFRACWKEEHSVPSRRQLEAFLERKNILFASRRMELSLAASDVWPNESLRSRTVNSVRPISFGESSASNQPVRQFLINFGTPF